MGNLCSKVALLTFTLLKFSLFRRLLFCRRDPGLALPSWDDLLFSFRTPRFSNILFQRDQRV